jgi:hypothetical protein
MPLYCHPVNRRRFKEAAKRLQEVDRVVRTLDPAVRGQAFSVLSPYAVGRRDSAEAVEQKSKLRELLERLAQENAELDELLRREYDELFVETSDPDELQLRLQTAMQRQAEMLAILSNILKKLSCTEKQIVQNLK